MKSDTVLFEKANVTVRRNEPKDDAQIEALIRYCLIEYDGVRENTAWYDPYLGRFSEVYDR